MVKGEGLLSWVPDALVTPRARRYRQVRRFLQANVPATETPKTGAHGVHVLPKDLKPHREKRLPHVSLRARILASRIKHKGFGKLSASLDPYDRDFSTLNQFHVKGSQDPKWNLLNYGGANTTEARDATRGNANAHALAIKPFKLNDKPWIAFVYDMQRTMRDDHQRDVDAIWKFAVPEKVGKSIIAAVKKRPGRMDQIFRAANPHIVTTEAIVDTIAAKKVVRYRGINRKPANALVTFEYPEGRGFGSATTTRLPYRRQLSH